MQCQGRSRWQRSNQGRTTGARQAGRDGEGRRATGRRPSVLQVLSAKLHWIPLTATVSMVTARCFAVTIRPAPPTLLPKQTSRKADYSMATKNNHRGKMPRQKCCLTAFPKGMSSSAHTADVFPYVNMMI